MSSILIAYASRTGCTREAAGIIAGVLRGATDAEVDLRRVEEAGDPSSYSEVVVGSAARRKRGWLSEARHWPRDHEAELSGLPVAYFMTCWVLRANTPAAYAEAAGYVELVRQKVPAVKPVAIGLFPGRLDLGRFSAFDRFWMNLKHAPAGDWFDPGLVRGWAAELPERLCDRSGTADAAVPTAGPGNLLR